MLSSYSIENVPICRLFHDDKPAYKSEGHGGQPVWQWPIYEFFKLYHEGSADEAVEQFRNWYMEQYHKYGSVEKSKGGMKNGSLDRLYQSLQASDNQQGEFEQAVQLRVEQRLQLLKQIREHGYKPNKKDPVKAFKVTQNSYMLFGGHHRVAALAALGYEYVPDVYIFRNRLAYNGYKLLSRIRKH